MNRLPPSYQIYRGSAVDTQTKPYPPSPWKLKGTLFTAVCRVRAETARSLIPGNVRLLTLGGRTLGGILLIRYGPGSTIQYNELIVFPAVVSRNGKIGIWISHIYVDDVSSLKGGREMYGVPKEMAAFEGQPGRDRQVRVLQEGQLLLSVSMGKPGITMPMPVYGKAMGDAAGDIRMFTAKGWGRLGMVTANLLIPAGSPFSALELEQPLFAGFAPTVQASIGDILVLT